MRDLSNLIFLLLAPASTFSNTVMIGIALVGLAYGPEGMVVLLTSATVVLELAVAHVDRGAAGGAALTGRVAALAERIQQRHVEMLEIGDVARDHRQLVNSGRGCNHRVLDQRIRSPMHEASPGAEHTGIHGQYVVRGRDHVRPRLDLGSLAGILFSCDLNARLNFSKRHCRKVQFAFGDRLQPGKHCAVRARSA